MEEKQLWFNWGNVKTKAMLYTPGSVFQKNPNGV